MIFIRTQKPEEAPNTRWGRTKTRFGSIFNVRCIACVLAHCQLVVPCSTSQSQYGRNCCPRHSRLPCRNHTPCLFPSMTCLLPRHGMCVYLLRSLLVDMRSHEFWSIPSAASWLADGKKTRGGLFLRIFIAILRDRCFHDSVSLCEHIHVRDVIHILTIL